MTGRKRGMSGNASRFGFIPAEEKRRKPDPRLVGSLLSESGVLTVLPSRTCLPRICPRAEENGPAVFRPNRRGNRRNSCFRHAFQSTVPGGFITKNVLDKNPRELISQDRKHPSGECAENHSLGIGCYGWSGPFGEPSPLSASRVGAFGPCGPGGSSWGDPNPAMASVEGAFGPCCPGEAS